MCSKTTTINYTNSDLMLLKDKIVQADAVVIGAGAGLSASAGLVYGGERFETLFPDFIDRYNLTDMYSSAFYPFLTEEEFWAYFSRHIYHNRYESQVNDCYKTLLSLVEEKDYFVITTNADHLFIKNGFDKSRLFYTQGDYGLFQCAKPCHSATYDNEEVVRQMVAQQSDCKIPSHLIPTCPQCGGAMSVNLRKDGTFVEDNDWHEAARRYEGFLNKHKNGNILFLELGVGYNTPSIIKYPFWQMTYQNHQAYYVNINHDDTRVPKEISTQTLGVQGDIGEVLRQVFFYTCADYRILPW